MTTINLHSTRKEDILTDPKFIKDLEDQMWLLEEEMDTMVIHTDADASHYFNLVKEHNDMEDVLTSLIDDDGHNR